VRLHYVERGFRLPLAIGNPVAVDLPGRGDGEPSCRLAVVHGFVQCLGLQRHRLRIRAVEAGVVIFAVHPKRDRHQPHIALGQELDHGDGARAALGRLLGLRLRLALIGSLMLGSVAKLGRRKAAKGEDDKHRNGRMARFAV